MLRGLLPRDVNFFEYFEKHSALTVAAARELRALGDDGARIPDHVRKIKDLEHEADDSVRGCLEKLHTTFITPIDRNDIHRLITELDDVLDLIDDTAGKIHLYEIHRLTPSMRQAADILVRATGLIERVVKSLRKIGNGTAILADCAEIKKLETEGDAIYHDSVGRLFKEERDPVALIKWREIIEGLESATDACESVANLIEGIVLEHV